MKCHEAVSIHLMDIGDDSAQVFPLTEYCSHPFILTTFLTCMSSSPKCLWLFRVVITSVPVNRMIRQLEGN